MRGAYALMLTLIPTFLLILALISGPNLALISTSVETMFLTLVLDFLALILILALTCMLRRVRFLGLI